MGASGDERDLGVVDVSVLSVSERLVSDGIPCSPGPFGGIESVSEITTTHTV